MHRDRDDLGVTEVEEVSHDLSDPVKLDHPSTTLLELDLDVLSSFDHVPVSQLILHECSQPFVGQGLLSLLGYLLPDDLWLGPKLSDDVRDTRGGDPELLGEVLHRLAAPDGSICDFQLLSGCHRSLAFCLLSKPHGGYFLEGLS